MTRAHITRLALAFAVLFGAAIAVPAEALAAESKDQSQRAALP